MPLALEQGMSAERSLKSGAMFTLIRTSYALVNHPHRGRPPWSQLTHVEAA